MGIQRNEAGRRAVWLAGLAMVMVAAPCFAQDRIVTIEKPKVYQHRDANGVRTFSDLKRIPGAHYLGEYGRPTATASCRGYTPEMLEARGAQYDAFFAGHAQSYGLETALVKAVARVESCFDVRAVSRVGAQGLMQLMPETASLVGVFEPFVADKNISGGAAYLKMMLDRFSGDVSLALAAYNAGPEAVQRYRGIPPYRETRDYVQRVTAAYHQYQAASKAPQLTPTSFAGSATR